MTNSQHLIEIAIGCIEYGQDFEDFISSSHTRMMAKSININPQYVWEMAQHVYCCIKPLWEDDLMEIEE